MAALPLSRMRPAVERRHAGGKSCCLVDQHAHGDPLFFRVRPPLRDCISERAVQLDPPLAGGLHHGQRREGFGDAERGQPPVRVASADPAATLPDAISLAAEAFRGGGVDAVADGCRGAARQHHCPSRVACECQPLATLHAGSIAHGRAQDNPDERGNLSMSCRS